MKGRRGGSPSLRPRDVAAWPTSCSACRLGAQFLGLQVRSRPVRGGPVGHQGPNSCLLTSAPQLRLRPTPEGQDPQDGGGAGGWAQHVGSLFLAKEGDNCK